jgi:hypothetical protein
MYARTVAQAIMLLPALGTLACSGSAPAIAGCAAGTVEENGTCVDASTADGGSGFDASDGSSAADGVAPSDGPAGAEGGALTDDPCPPGTMYLAFDCTGQCKTGTQSAPECQWGCDYDAGQLDIVRPKPQELPYVVRTPTSFASETACTNSCPAGGEASAFRLVVALDYIPITDYTRMRVRVEPPFFVASAQTNHPSCYTPPTTNCVAFTPSGEGAAFVSLPAGVTETPARNIYVELVSGTGPVCP